MKGTKKPVNYLVLVRWGYDVKGVEENRAEVIFAENNFWGRYTKQNTQIIKHTHAHTDTDT